MLENTDLKNGSGGLASGMFTAAFLTAITVTTWTDGGLVM